MRLPRLTLVATLVLAGCIPAGLKGVTLTPKSFGAADFLTFLELAPQAGKVLTWSGDWIEFADEVDGGPKITTELAATLGMTPVCIAQFFTQATGELLRPLDAPTKAIYKSSAVAFATKYKPKYLGFGIEINVLEQKAPIDFGLFAGFFSEVCTAVKAASPGTQVFTVFQLEKMKGLNGGLFGGENDPSQAQWDLLAMFPKADFFAFTSYPGLIYTDPPLIPADYYQELKTRTSKRIGFTEIGWHVEDSPAGWESDEAEQAEFVTRFASLTAGLGKEMEVWSFMFDQATIEPFRSMGLRREDGTARPAWGEWVK